MIQPDLHSRLVNWAMFVRDVTKQDVSATGRFCEQLATRAGKGVWQTTAARRVIDELDGQLVEDAWRRCEPGTKEFLKILYVWNAKPDFVCRRLKIPHRPKHVFDLRRYHAEQEIARQLEEPERRAVARTVTPRIETA